MAMRMKPCRKRLVTRKRILFVYQNTSPKKSYKKAWVLQLLSYFSSFQMSVESDGAINDNDEAERKVVQEGMGSTTLIVIIVVIVLLLIIGIAVALYFVRKNKSCCFSTSNTKNVESGGAANMTVDDQMTTQPLNYGDGIPDEGDKTTRPIIKPEWARPQ